MTSNPKGFEQPLPAGTRTIQYLPPSRTSSQFFKQPPRSWPHQSITPLYNAPARAMSRKSLEPAAKRQKLENAAGASSDNAAFEGSAKRNTIAATARSQLAPDALQYEKQPRVPKQLSFPLWPGGRPLVNTRRSRPLAIERAARRDVVPVKAYVPEPPSCAPQYHGDGPADFFPWFGNHPEDLLNDTTIKTGHFDTYPASQNDSNTARPSVWSSLKHKSGLQILSSLFVSALDQRQADGTITANSTFKPPPRVTLTDTKREAWLRDLANPIIPLRRLSRTIPHGIRGKILLDQCLSKNIPTSRAIWLAKCVGANEIRAFKRKGTGGVFTVGGEAKWIKDWTINIEQFVESIIAMCGCPDWKAKINYGLQLVLHLYSDNLLDQDHYLDWLIRSIRDSDLDSVPIWLLIQKIHQEELLQHSQRGRRLAGAILGQIQIVSASSMVRSELDLLICVQANSTANKELYGSVLYQLLQLLRSTMIAVPACFLLLDRWDQYKETIEDCVIGLDDDQLGMCLENISRRNTILVNHPLRQSRQLSSSLGQRLIAHMDTLSTNPGLSKVAGACLRLSDDNDVLVRTCIEWSASIYRHGHFRIYAAARLLRIWAKHGVDVERPVFDLLASNPDAEGLCKKDLYRLLARLMSSKNLSVARYLQWLMARGTLHGRHQPGPDCPCDVGLLFEVPLHDLPSHVLNLRQTLVSSRVEGPPDQESQLIAATKTEVAEQLPDLFKPTIPSTDRCGHADRTVYLSQSVKSEVTWWIRQNLIWRISSRIKGDGCNNDEPQMQNSRSKPSNFVTLAEFMTIRSLLESVEDFAILADVLVLLSDQAEGQTLTAITDTVNQHFAVFSAIGAAGNLFRKLYHNVGLDNGQEREEAFLESLIDLGCRLPEAKQATRRLRNDLSARAPRPSAAACSPISDTMVEALQLTEPTFADEMDQMLASGTSIDKQNFNRVFVTITRQLEKSFVDTNSLILRFSRLLARLRGFGPKLFDLLLENWLQSWLQAEPFRNLSITLAPMICSRVSSLGAILASIVRLMNTSESDRRYKANLALDTLALLTEIISGKTTVVEYRRYRLLDQLQSLLRTSPTSILAIIRGAVDACDSEDSTTQRRAKSQAQSDAVKELVHMILLQQAEPASQPSSIAVDFISDPASQKAVGRILHLDEPRDTTRAESPHRIMSVLNNISDFNLSLAHLELKAILASSNTASEDSSIALSKLVIERAVASADGQAELLAYLVSQLPPSQVNPIRERVQREILAWALDDSSTATGEYYRPNPALIAIAEAASFCVPPTETWALMEKMAEALSGFLLPPQPEDSHQVNPEADMSHWLQRVEILLRLLAVHSSGIQHPKAPQTLVFQILISLSLLLIHPLLTPSSTLSNYTYDVLLLLSNSLSDETRSRCIRSLRDHHRTRDPRLRFIFGYSDTIECEWLQLTAKSPSAIELRLEGAAPPHLRPYPLRRWEMMQDATPVATENDTSLSLTLFGSRKFVL